MFITNKGNVGEQPAKAASMSERLREIIPMTGTLSILSGYFYFNGVPPLMGPIAENKDLTLRILVGLDVDKMGYELAHEGGRRFGAGEVPQLAQELCAVQDVRQRTLPDHVLHDIIKAKKKGWPALDSYLSSLKDGMGADYASLLLPGEDDDVVIVAIDKQVDG